MRRHPFLSTIPLGRLVVGLLVLAGPAARAGDGARAPEFGEQVRAHFARWDANHDNRLTRAELDRLVDDPSVRGKEAAAVAALVRVARGDSRWKKPTEFTRDELTAIAGRSLLHRPTDPPLAAMFLDGAHRLSHTTRSLFPDTGPSLQAFHQGTLGDCFVVAPLGAAVARDPAAVRRMIQHRPGGGYRVTFGNGAAIDVPPLTDTEIILSSASGHGLWVNVFEKAYATYRTRQAPKEKQPESVLETISHGGKPVLTIEALTGHRVRVVSIRADKDPPPAAAAAGTTAEQIDRALRQGMTDHRLACAITASKLTTPGLPTHHVYAILGYNAARREVRLWNPHGNTFTPKGPPGPATGYPTKDGFFNMPLADAVQAFVSVAVEDGR
jgi:hypothetical protein